MLSAAHSATKNEFMLFEKMEMPSALLTICDRGEEKNPNMLQWEGGRFSQYEQQSSGQVGHLR